MQARMDDHETLKLIAAGDAKLTAVALFKVHQHFKVRELPIQAAVCLRAAELLIEAAESTPPA